MPRDMRGGTLTHKGGGDMHRLRSIGAPFLVAVLGVILAAAAGASTTEHAFTGTEAPITFIDNGTHWTSGQIEQTRGLVRLDEVVTDFPGLTGVSTVTINGSRNLVTGKGSSWGTFDLSAAGGSGFAGSFTGKFTPAWSGDAVGTGYGEFAGWQMRSHLVGGSGDPVNLSGYLFSPADK